MVVPTTILALVALVSLGLQARSTRAALHETRRAAAAAEASADHLQATERPWLIVQSDRPPEGWPTETTALGATPPDRITVAWSVTNHGKTPGWIERWGIIVELRPWPLPDAPIVVTMEPANALPITDKKPFGHETPVILQQEDWLLIVRGSHCLAFYGEVEYRDAFGGTRITRFCETWRWVPVQVPGQRPLRLHEYLPVGPTPEWTRYT